MLQWSDSGGGYARCAGCGALAVGPCARCRAPLCGDCCVLTEGGAGTYAICRECEGRGGRSLRRAWWLVMGWFLWPILALAVVVFLLSLWFG